MAGESQIVGHRASARFQIVIAAPSDLERVLSGVVEAGADTVHAVSFQTRRLRELRDRARGAAVEAARRKAAGAVMVTYALLG